VALISTPGLFYPPMDNRAYHNGVTSSAVIDAPNEKIAAIGRVYWPGGAGGTKDIRKIGFRFGAVTKTNGSGLTLSLQDVDLTTGPVYQPDGTQDQTYAIANGNAAFATNTWFLSGNLSTDRTVNFGDLLATVLEYDGSGHQTGDSVVMSLLASGTPISGMSLYTGSWASVGFAPPILFEFSDGTFGSYIWGMPFSTASNLSYSDSTNPDENGVAITMPFAAVISGASINVAAATNTSTYTIYLYDSADNVLASVVVDPNAITAINTGNLNFYLFATPVTVAAGDLVRLTVKATTAGQSVFMPQILVDNANHWSARGWGDNNWYATSRNNGAGAWTDTTTRRFPMSLIIDQIDDGAGGGGGLLTHPGKQGGFQ
jgi:hypothetical protein